MMKAPEMPKLAAVASRVDVRVGSVSPDGSIELDHQYHCPGSEAEVSFAEKQRIVANLAAWTKPLLLPEQNRIMVTFQAGNPESPPLSIQFATHDENYRMICADATLARVCAENCTKPSNYWRLWWRDEVFGEYTTEAKALAYRKTSNLKLSITPPWDTNFYHLIAFILALL